MCLRYYYLSHSDPCFPQFRKNGLGGGGGANHIWCVKGEEMKSIKTFLTGINESYYV